MNPPKKEPIDNSAHYKVTEYPGRDSLYNWIVKRYGKHGNEWKKSDSFIFGGMLYHVWDWVPSLAFVFLTWFLVNLAYTHYGEFKAYVTLGVMILFRLNAMIRQMKMTNRLLKG